VTKEERESTKQNPCTIQNNNKIINTQSMFLFLYKKIWYRSNNHDKGKEVCSPSTEI